ncbi:MAG: hypothetical protein K2K75_08515 [Muribaculaceae bacterium]|nr:hypothetical protein [Muribaculaceae bacterium]
MEEDRLKDIFKEYEPDLSSRMAFMERLERNLNAVEIIHRENALATKRNRLAVICASIVGFLVGFLFSFALPYISNMIAEFEDFISTNSVLSNLNAIPEFQSVIAWIIIGAVSVFTSIGTYNMVLNYRPLTSGRRED